MITPVILYTTAGMPIGARALVTFYRPPASADSTVTTNIASPPLVAQVVPFGSEGTGTNLGTYVIEDLGLDLSGNDLARMDSYGADADKALVRKTPTLSMTAQMGSAGTVTLCPGDYCALLLGMAATSTGASPVGIPTSRWFVTSDSIPMNQNQANKFNLKLAFDRQNSSPNLSQF
jgi:hypothetical protein